MVVRHIVAAMVVIGLVTACSADKPSTTPTTPAGQPGPVVDMHTSRTSLDWAGTYEGVLGCTDCAGVRVLLTLEQDASFVLVTAPLIRGVAPSTERGRFEWQPDGNSIVLGGAAGDPLFAVGEGRLILRSAGDGRLSADGPNALLMHLSSARTGDRSTLAGVLIDHHWTLVDARDASNRRIDALFPAAVGAFSFGFAESRLHVQGGCNGFRGAFAIGGDDLLRVSGGVSTRMACDMPLMEADDVLSALIVEPMEVVLIGGDRLTLALLTPAGDVLVLSGELTHEARLGAPTTVFLEVAAQRVPCDRSILGDGTCLQVREVRFDERGLMSGDPGEWQILAHEIEGYRHEPGVRNVVRIKRFQSVAHGGETPAAIDVLDLVVQSEVVSQ